jgi:biotin carboxyl carrier protein
MTDDPVKYQVVLNGDEEQTLEITGQDLAHADLLQVSESVLHLLSDRQGHAIQVVHADYANKEFTLLVNDKTVSVKLRDTVEMRVHAMGFDINRNHVKPRQIISPMPGLVLKILAAEGETVEEGQAVLILEAMKMENVLNAPVSGVVNQIHAEEGKNVDKGQVLVEFT